MKILHIVNGNDSGGATTQVGTLISEQCKARDVFVLSIGVGKISKLLTELGVSFECIDLKMSTMLKIRDFVLDKVSQGYILHAHGLKPMIVLALVANTERYKNNKTKMIVTIHSDYHHEYKKKKIKKMVAIPVFKYVSKLSDSIIVVSEAFKEVLVADGIEPSKIHFIENGAAMSTKIHNMTREEFLSNHGINNVDKDTVICGIVARIHAVKGIDVVIKACNILREKNVLFLVAGSGDDELLSTYNTEIKELNLEDKIKFLGYLDNIGDFYNIIDINMISSYSEALSYSVLESAYHKKALVCTNVTGLKNVLEDKKDAMIVPIGDYQKFADAISQLLDDRELALRLGNALYEKVEKKYNSKTMANKYYNVYES